jgi:hypothetical protein
VLLGVLFVCGLLVLGHGVDRLRAEHGLRPEGWAPARVVGCVITGSVMSLASIWGLWQLWPG